MRTAFLYFLLLFFATPIVGFGSLSTQDSLPTELLWRRKMGVAEYKWSSPGPQWENEVRRVSNITLTRAFEIAEADQSVRYFFYMKSGQLYLEGNAQNEAKGVFRKGDAVFFSGKPQWGTAHGYSDGYVKVYR